MGIASQVVTLIAVLAGAGASYLGSKLTEKDRFARELRIRWDQRRLDAYVAFMSAAKTTGTHASRIHEQRINGDTSTGLAHQIDELTRSDLRRSEAFESLVLLADASTIEAAHLLNRAVWNLEHPARLGKEIEEQDWLRMADQWIVAINDFHAAARSDLQVSGAFVRRDIAALAVSRPERAQVST
jgi:hypothetical protein